MPDCRLCSASLSEDARFCSRCGVGQKQSESGEPLSRAQEHLLRVSRYLPRHLVTHLATEQHAPVGMRSVAAVVFADVSGFTSMSERMDPEEVLEVMNGCFEGLVQAVEKYGGMVDKFIGDCLMAVFGVPDAHEDDAARAVRACREMLDYLKVYNKTLAKPLGLSIGVNYGTLVAGNLGSQTRMDYTVMGDTVNLSQRLESAANSGQILVSASVQKAAGAQIEFTPLEPIRVKGKRDAVSIFAAGDDLPDPELAAHVLPCIGRQKHVAVVLKALGEEGAGRIVEVVGDAGVGKSRIAAEVAACWPQAESRGPAWMAVAPGPGHQRPYGAAAALVRCVCGWAPDDAPAHGRMKLLVLRDLGVPEGWQLFLSHIAQPGNSDVCNLAPATLLDGVIGAMRVLFERLSTLGHLVVLDGLNAFDEHSLRVFDKLWAEQAPEGLRVVVTRRDETRSIAAAQGLTRRLKISGVDEATVEAIVKARLDLNAVPGEAVRFLCEGSGGNPRLLLELIGSLIDQGFIYRSADTYVIRDDIASAPRANSLASLVRSRVDRLTPEQKYLLQAGALLGMSFDGDVAATAVQGSRDGSRRFAEVVRTGLLTPVGHKEYCFAHTLAYEAALGGLMSTERAALCGRLGEALEGRPEGAREQTLPMLARLFGASQKRDKAVYYLERAGGFLLRVRDLSGAAAAFSALANKHDPADAADAAARTRAYLMEAKAWELGGELEKAVQVLATAQQTGAQHGLRDQLGTCHRAQARVLRLRGDLQGAATYAEASLKATQQGSAKVEDIAWTLFESSEVDMASGDLAAATEKLERVRRAQVETSPALYEGSLQGRCLGRLARIALQRDEVDQARGLLLEAIGICEAAGDQQELVRLYGNYAVACTKLGTDSPQPVFERAIAVARRLGDRLGEAKQQHNLGSYLASQGNTEQARACFQQSHDLSRAIGWKEGIAMNSHHLRLAKTS